MDMKWKLTYILIFSCIYAAEACLKNNEPDGGSGSNSGSTPAPDSCTSQESANAKCFNGGQCSVIIVAGQRTIQCKCQSGFEGAQCEYKPAPQVAGLGSIESGAIAGIVIGVLVLVAILGGIVFLVFRKKQKDSRPKLEGPPFDDEPSKNQISSNYLASRYTYESNPQSYSNFNTPGRNNPAYNSSDVSTNHIPPYTISNGNFSSSILRGGGGGGGGGGGNSTRRSGMTVVDSADIHSGSRPPSSSGGSLYQNSGSIGPFKTPLAYHETGV